MHFLEVFGLPWGINVLTLLILLGGILFVVCGLMALYFIVETPFGEAYPWQRTHNKVRRLLRRTFRL